MSDFQGERRQFTRVGIDLPVEVHQGGSVWNQRTINIGLSGVTTDQPELWDAQYNEPFTLMVAVDSETLLELHAYLQHAEAGHLGFSVEHVDRSNIEPLKDLLAAHMDVGQLEKELMQLDNPD